MAKAAVLRTLPALIVTISQTSSILQSIQIKIIAPAMKPWPAVVMRTQRRDIQLAITTLMWQRKWIPELTLTWITAPPSVRSRLSWDNFLAKLTWAGR
jgi:hypothetical protein